MPHDAALALFFAASFVVIVAPGPDNILVLTRGLAIGRRAALVSAGGASVGLVGHSLLAVVGLSAILASSAAAYSVVKYVGAAYLIYLGIRAFLDREGFVSTRDDAPPMSLRSVFWQAVVSNLLNPKIAVFFLAYLPQFVAPGVGVASLRLLSLGIAFALMTWAIFSVFAVFSGKLGVWMRRKPAVSRGLGWLTGGVLVALGLQFALSDRR